jgi:hypothetical protein
VFVLLLLLHSLFILEEWTGKSGMTPIEFRYQKHQATNLDYLSLND